MNDRTIAAISTAQGEGGIGIIRISGEAAIEVADSVFLPFSQGKKLSDLLGYRAMYGKIVFDGEILDEAVALVYRAPHSYTGEDVVELCCHGGLLVLREVLRAVLASGAALAEAGEFTKRAFLSGKMDLSEAQAVMDIIGAQSRQAMRTANAQRGGALSRRVDKIKSSLLSLTAHLSAWADFPEEDIPEISDENVKNTLDSVLAELRDILSSYNAGKAVLGGVDTVIVGKPNVGKSTIMNLLSGFEKSIVTEIPGTTRDIVEEAVIVGGVTLRLSDTAGLRDTENLVEKIGVDKAREKLRNSSLVLAVFDSSRELDSDDLELLDQLSLVPTIAIINKTDLENKIDVSTIREKVQEIVYFNAISGDGIKNLSDSVEKICSLKEFSPSAGIISTERERDTVRRAIDSICEAETALLGGFSLDAVTVCIEDSVSCLMELTGENASEAVINEVFHKFCLGK